MKVLILSGTYPPLKCGVGAYSLLFMEALKKKGIEVQLLTSQGALKAEGVYPEIKVWKMSALPQIIEFIQKLKPNIIDLQYPTIAYRRKIFANLLPFLLRLKGIKIPIVTTFHEFTEVGYPGKLRSLLLILLSQHVILKNKADLEILKRIFFWKKFTPIPVGSAIRINHPLAKEEKQVEKTLNNEEEKKYLLIYFGFIDESKGIDDLIKCIQILHSRGLPTKVLIIGNFDPQKNAYHQYLANLVNTLKLDSTISWLGFLPENMISIFLQKAAIAVFPFKKGVSLRRTTVIAALTHGLPVITTLGKYTTSDFINGKNIILIEPKNPTVLAKTIEELLQNQTLLQTLKRNSKIFAQSFTWETIADNSKKFYQSLL